VLDQESFMAMTFESLEPIPSTLLFVILTMAFAVPIYSQSDPANPTSDEPKPQASRSIPAPDRPSSDTHKAEPSTPATPQELRQAQIEADTKKLYQLSAELRAEVAKTYKESLSLTVLKNAQEIEKLAKSLKAEMNQEAAAAKQLDR
jgi:hypothetical protein